MKETQLTIPEQETITRINKSCAQPFYYVFQDVVSGMNLITTAMRKEIVARWAKLTPLIPENNLRHHLFNVEKKYWASIPPWTQQELTNKITHDSIGLINEVMDSNESIIRKAKTVNDLNQTVAKTNRLIDQAPAATFLIQTNINEEEMISKMNAIDITPEEDEDAD